MAGKNPQTPKGEAAVQYLKDHPTMPLLTLAKLMHKKEPKVFTDVEQTRRMLRGYTGSAGKTRCNADKHGTRRVKGISGADAWKEMMPTSWMEGSKVWKLPKSIKKLAVLSDIHAPFHDEAALTIAIDYCIKEKPDAILLNGDTLDFYATSDHEKDPRKVDWMAEIEAGKSLLRMMRLAFPGIPIYFKAGNHEYRLERHLMKYAQILLGMPEFELPNLLAFGENGIQYIPNKTNIIAGKLNIIHGDEYRGAGGINPARWLSLRTGEPTLCGHFHRTSTHMDRTIRDDIRGWWSSGCLCEISPSYLPYNQWNQGFAIVNINNDGTFEVENLTIINGKVR